MKKNCIFIIIALVLSGSVHAGKIKGQIISGKDTMNVVFRIPFGFFSGKLNYEALQQKVVYYDASGQKQTLRPQHASEYRFKYNNTLIRMITCKKIPGMAAYINGNPKIFLHLQVDGKLKLFRYYFKRDKTAPGLGHISIPDAALLYQKGNSTLKKTNQPEFRPEMMQYFSDCPELSKKIETGEFRRTDIKKIAEFYNSHCGF